MYSVYIKKAWVNENWTIVNSLWIKSFGIKSTEFHNSSIFNLHSSFLSYAFQPFPLVGTNCGHGGTGRISLAGTLVVGIFVKTSIAKIVYRN